MSDKLIKSPLFEKIREYLSQAKNDDQIFLYVPFINPSILEKLIEGIDSQIVIVTSWNTNHLLSGVSHLELWPFCKKRGIILYVHKHIHLKIYSVGFEDLILASANISKTGLNPSGTFKEATVECATFVEEISNEDRVYFENIRKNARRVDDEMYQKLLTWYESQEKRSIDVDKFDEIVPAPKKDHFLISALPMTRSTKILVESYLKISEGKEPSDDKETFNCVYHDLSNYEIEFGLTKEQFLKKLKTQFFSHPFILKFDKIIDKKGVRFGIVRRWFEENCTDVPIPRRNIINENVNVLYKWFVELWEEKYETFVFSNHTESIKKLF